MSHQFKVLLATRAIESPPREGGFVLLMDIAKKMVNNPVVSPNVFSYTKQQIPGIGVEKVFSKSGWGPIARQQFIFGLLRKAHKYDIVHTAHIPTNQNVPLIKNSIRHAKRKGTYFVQTITGLPRVDISLNELDKLLWGDHIVCQSASTFDRAKKIRDSVSLITPWASPSRISLDPKRRASTRKKLLSNQSEKLVLFPGEFERLGVDESFGDCLETFFGQTSNCKVILTCRFDKEKIGEKIAARFPDKVVSLGETKDIIELIEAADLTIYPVKKMDSKFQPPLVLIESLQLDTPVLASNLIDIKYPGAGQINYVDIGNSWSDFARKMAHAITNKSPGVPIDHSQLFTNMLKSYEEIYLSTN